MRIRLPFAGAFFSLLLVSAYLGLTTLHLESYLNDKAAHFLAFFILTTCFYWILDTTRRRALNVTLLVCTALLGIGSEFLQGLLPNDRTFDPYDILANIVGSLAALALSTWYHKRMLERKRAAKSYTLVPGDEGNEDLELGEGSGLGAQESGIVDTDGVVDAATAPVAHSLEAEVDNWDEHADDDAWDEEVEGEGPKTPSASSAGEAEHAAPTKKRAE